MRFRLFWRLPLHYRKCGGKSFGQFIVCPKAVNLRGILACATCARLVCHSVPDSWNGWVEPISLSDDDNNDRFATTKLMIKLLTMS